MSLYIVKWARKSEVPYLVGGGKPSDNPVWSAKQTEARRFKTKDEARAHVDAGFLDPATSWLANGSAKIVRLRQVNQ